MCNFHRWHVQDFKLNPIFLVDWRSGGGKRYGRSRISITRGNKVHIIEDNSSEYSSYSCSCIHLYRLQLAILCIQLEKNCGNSCIQLEYTAQLVAKQENAAKIYIWGALGSVHSWGFELVSLQPWPKLWPLYRYHKFMPDHRHFDLILCTYDEMYMNIFMRLAPAEQCYPHS